MKDIITKINESSDNIIWHAGDDLPKESKFNEPGSRKDNKITMLFVILDGKINRRHHYTSDVYKNVAICEYYNDGEIIFKGNRKKLKAEDKWCYLDDILKTLA